MFTIMRFLFCTLLVLLTFLLPSRAFAQCPELIWSDEFDGTSLNLADWNTQIGDGCDIHVDLCGWGNNERQYYRAENALVSDGTLKIIAKLENIGGRAYSSARITTQDKQDFRYGRMEARIKVPAGRGTWPAFWMLPTDEVYGYWPQSGEIDIMEYVGHHPAEALGTIHFGDPKPNNAYQGRIFELLEGEFHENFHDFAVEWEEDEIRWFVDDILYSTKRPSDLGGFDWPFDQDFHFILNLAIGGDLGGTVDNSIFPATMEVDYVRVYNGNRPYLTGARRVENAETDVLYRLGNVSAGTPVTWTVPEGATIVSGQGTPVIRVDWGGTSGTLSAAAELSCGTQTLEMDVAVAPAFVREYSFENFDDAPNAEFEFATGTLTEVNTPQPNSVNSSARSGRYARETQNQFDVIVYRVNTITNAAAYAEGDKRFSVDVYTDAPIGTEVLLQLETNAALPANYPTGRHSRYTARTREKSNWHRLTFTPLDEPDPATADNGVVRMVLLFSPNSINGNTYYYDNLNSYVQETSSVAVLPAAAPALTITPNPAATQAWVRFELAERARVTLDLYDLSGRRVGRLPEQDLPAGAQQLAVPLAKLPDGVYLARLRVGATVHTARLVKQR